MDAVLTYVAECLEKFAEENSLSKERVYTCIVARMDALGQKFHSNVDPTMRILADFISMNKETSAAIIVAPNTGCAENVYNEAAINMAVQEVEALTRQEQLSLRIRRCNLYLDADSLAQGGPSVLGPWSCFGHHRYAA